jgi:lysophospholipase L1-like esterase
MKLLQSKIKKRYSIYPELFTYDSIGYLMTPNLNFINQPNFRSKMCNTDELGLRFNNYDNQTSIFEENHLNKEEILFVGGSTAMGMAATNDQNTIPSILSRKLDYHFYNFGVKACNGLQEILLFLLLANKLKKLKKIIIFSGINDLYFSLDSNFSKNFPGPTVFGNQYFDLVKHENILKKFKRIFTLNSKIRLGSDQSLEMIISRNMNIWSKLSRGYDFEIIYILQPFLTWCKNQSDLEKKAKAMDYGSNEMMKFMDQSHKNLSEILIKNCKLNYIKFYDINNNDFRNKEDMFVDRAHLTNKGFEVVSEIIKKQFFK